MLFRAQQLSRRMVGRADSAADSKPLQMLLEVSSDLKMDAQSCIYKRVETVSRLSLMPPLTHLKSFLDVTVGS